MTLTFLWLSTSVQVVNVDAEKGHAWIWPWLSRLAKLLQSTSERLSPGLSLLSRASAVLKGLMCVQDLAFVLGTAYESWCILTVGFYIRLFEFRIAPCRWFAYVSPPP